MTKKIILFIFSFIISGCVGDQLEFRNKGTVFFKDDHFLCIKSMPGDTLTYYLLSSSENNYSPPLLVGIDINVKYPATCVHNITLKKNVFYDFTYILNGIKYRAEFSLDESNNIKPGI